MKKSGLWIFMIMAVSMYGMTGITSNESKTLSFQIGILGRAYMMEPVEIKIAYQMNHLLNFSLEYMGANEGVMFDVEPPIIMEKNYNRLGLKSEFLLLDHGKSKIPFDLSCHGGYSFSTYEETVDQTHGLINFHTLVTGMNASRDFRIFKGFSIEPVLTAELAGHLVWSGNGLYTSIKAPLRLSAQVFLKTKYIYAYAGIDNYTRNYSATNLYAAMNRGIYVGLGVSLPQRIKRSGQTDA